MSYTLWCPDMDGQQHIPCIYPTDNVEMWDHIPTEAEQIAALTRPLTADEAAGQRGHRFWRDVWAPSNCHFDKVDPNGERPDWPNHWHPSWLGKHVNLGGWAGGPHEYPLVKRLYRCSVHNKPPQYVTTRYAPKREGEWNHIQNEKFRRFQIVRDPANVAQLYAGRPIPDPLPYFLHRINGWVLNRPAPRTTHDAW